MVKNFGIVDEPLSSLILSLTDKNVKNTNNAKSISNIYSIWKSLKQQSA